MIGHDKASRAAAHVLNTVLVSTKRRESIVRDTGLVVRCGRYGRKEASEIEDWVDAFLAENNLRMEGLHEYVSHGSKGFPFRELAEYVARNARHRSLLSVYLFLHYRYHPSYSQEWTLESDVVLLESIRNHGKKWVEISREMNRAERYIRAKYLHMTRERVKPEHVERLCKRYKLSIDKETLNELSKWARPKVSQKIESLISKRSTDSWNSGLEAKLCTNVLFLNYYANRAPGSPTQEDGGHPREIFDLAIEPEDVFWENIRRKMGLPTRLIRAKFSKICNTNGIRKFGDLDAHISRICSRSRLESRKRDLLCSLSEKRPGKRVP